MLKLLRHLKYPAIAACIVCAVFALATVQATQDVAPDFAQVMRNANTTRLTDRFGQPLAVTYQTAWNLNDQVPLHQIPPLLQQAFVLSEDKRFYTHTGVDWHARGSALWQNIRAGGTVRGASTVTEQVVRMLYPRPRSLWSKWVEGFDARALEKKKSKPAILEFYLNQVPYAANRRGIAQAARYYFNRDLETLTPKEMLGLAVLVRAPSGYDLYKDKTRLDAAIARLANRLQASGDLVAADAAALATQVFELQKPSLGTNAAHFVSFVRRQPNIDGLGQTTLDAALQAKVQKILDDRIATLSSKNLHNGAALVVDHQTGEVLAWVVAGAEVPETPAGQIDAVTVARQPGSSLKPFLYAAALDRGWTAATLIDDAPVTEAIGTGLHRFRNYSHVFYGPVTLRDALGNSLNIPAVKTIAYVGVSAYLSLLHKLGFESLSWAADIYDEGLALGNGEVTLFELVQAYAALAQGGVVTPLRVMLEADVALQQQRVYSDAAATLIGNILSDPQARSLEFGQNSVLNFSLQTAVKTGTSTDYRDAWAVGYNDRYVAGIWMGNLDQQATDGVTGGTGPALALRSIFNELNRHRQPRKLRLSPLLVRADVCVPAQGEAEKCYMRSELMMPDTAAIAENTKKPVAPYYEVVKPTQGLQMAIDPRVPMDRQQFAFTLAGLEADQTVEWIFNGESLGAPTTDTTFLWSLQRGQHVLSASIRQGTRLVYTSPDITYLVK